MEFAARGGLDGATFCWGEKFCAGGRYLANTWQGPFPFQDLGLDGFVGRAPVGSFPPNGYGLHDMAGCAPNYCRRYRPAARHPQMIDTATCHIGLRCALHVPTGGTITGESAPSTSGNFKGVTVRC